MAPRKLAAGNWKMNGLATALNEVKAVVAAHPDPRVEILLCPPVTLLARANWLIRTEGGQVALGGQDCHAAASGAHTGDISAEMLADAGAAYVIVGHSERRSDHGETNETVRTKAEAAWRAGLTAIVCVGETMADRDAGRTLDVVGAQLGGSVPDGATATNSVIAYEPVWAIGTGKVPTATEIAEVHAFIRARIAGRISGADDCRILYGGSVKAANATEIFEVANVDGALVGGASLSAADFSPIVRALENA